MRTGLWALVVLALRLSDLPPVPAPTDTTHSVYPWTRPKSWDIAIARDDEPGPRLIMSGRVLGADSLPARGVDLYVYHADIQGYYARKRGQGNRIAGLLRTNERGEYRVRTVLPGTYEGSGPHIHFEVWKNGIPKRAAAVNLYAQTGTPPVSIWKVTKTASEEWKSGMAIIVADSDGVYWCHHDFVLSKMYEVTNTAPRDSAMRAAKMREVSASYDSIERAANKQGAKAKKP
jgi:hypothetical protein